AGLCALGAAAGGLALRALTTADARLGGVGAGDRTQVVHLQDTGTRCREVLPRGVLGPGSILLHGSLVGLLGSRLRGSGLAGAVLGGSRTLAGLLGRDGLRRLVL